MKARLLLVAVPALLGAAPAPIAEPIDYRITPELREGALERIAVQLRFRGEADGDTLLALPNRWAGSERLHEVVEDLRAEGGTIAAHEDPAWRVIRHAPGAMITVHYAIGRSEADPGAGYEKARPVVRPGWFYIHGEGALATPSGSGDRPARLSWGPSLPGWKLASSADDSGPLTIDGVVESILIGGTDLRILSRAVDGVPVRLALRGTWPFADEQMMENLARAVAAENLYMEAPAMPYFVSLIPLTGAETGAMSFGGTGRTGGFALAATGNVDLDRLLPMLAHEYGHRWFGGSLGPVPQPDAPDFWFTEGFNDFVAAQALLRSGVWSSRDYAERINEVLFRYAGSSARTLTNGEIAARFWQDEDAMQMHYDRGHLFAILLDAGSGAVRRALLRMAAAPESFPPSQTQAQRFLAAARVSPARLAAMLRGEPIELLSDAFGPCGSVQWAEQTTYASGYTVEERADGRFFASVDPNGPAWSAGLRPGMRYVRRESFRYRDSTVPLVMRVADAGGERVLNWLPRGNGTVRFQRLALATGADQAEACRGRLAGF